VIRDEGIQVGGLQTDFALLVPADLDGFEDRQGGFATDDFA
jgi:hypothetical protein